MGGGGGGLVCFLGVGVGAGLRVGELTDQQKRS